MDDQESIYFVRRQGKVEGPWDKNKLLSEAKRKKLGKFHEISTDKKNWVRADKFDWLFPKKLRKTTAEPVTESATDPTDKASMEANDQPANDTKWYLAINGEQVGPFAWIEIVDLVREHDLGPNDIIWHDGLTNWTALWELHEFDKILADKTLDPTSTTKLDGQPIIADFVGSRNPVSKLAVASLVSSILFCFPCAIAGIIFSLMALRDIKASQGELTGRNLAIAGCVLGGLGLIGNFLILIIWIISSATTLS